jgi:CRP-like cAMP-binding protein
MPELSIVCKDPSAAVLACKLTPGFIFISPMLVVSQEISGASNGQHGGGNSAAAASALEGRELQRGDLFGVMALTTNQPYFSTVIAIGTAAPSLCWPLAVLT